MKRNWKLFVLGTSIYRLAHKLKNVKLELKSWSKSTFGNFKHKLQRNADKLLHVEQKLVAQPLNARLNNWHYKLIKQCEKMHLFNQKYWGALAHKDWLVNGDRNTRYFHQTMKSGKSRSAIIRIKTGSGLTTLCNFNMYLLMTLSYNSNLHKEPLPSGWTSLLAYRRQRMKT